MLSDRLKPWALSVPFILCVAAAAFSNPPARRASGSGASASARAARTGAAIYQQSCARCHGAKGEGSDAYPHALAGSQSAPQLAQFIGESMPPGPKHCPSTDAAKVAAYIYDAFYSSIAQERNRPARVTLSRLTVRQLRNTVVDLVDSFRQPLKSTATGGLQAEYYKAKDFNDGDRVVQRVDPTVQFDFGTKFPTDGAFDAHQFCIRWKGSVLAPDTGNYDFVVHTDHALRLWVNDNRKPLIDAWVKSGNDTVYRGSIYLIGGRVYPLRLEFSKSSQGVDDTKKIQKLPPAPAMVTLAWQRPKQPEETIPARCLLPTESPVAYVLSTPFPPDDRSMGYERGNSISREWDDATTAAALDTAGYVAEHLRDLAGSADDAVKLKAFGQKFVERAFRRPLTPDLAALYVDRQFARAGDPVTAVKRVVILALKSPRFLYREAGQTDADPYTMASRLSYALWDSMPDDALLRAAADGSLANPDQLDQQANRLAADPRAWFKERDFLLQWLKVDQYPDLAKDGKRYPDFTPAVAADLRTSLDLTLESVVRSDASNFRDLVLSDKYYLNGRLAALYGVSLPPDAPFQPEEMDPDVRAGILTHPYILAAFAYVAGSDPIHRGVLLTRNVLGRTLQPPPAAFAPLAADLHPDLTTRQRVSLQTKPAMCQSCHGIINPLGFTLERFDAVGRVRAADNGKPVDCTGSYVTRNGQRVHFSGARDLAQFVADSDDAHAAFVQKLFQYLTKQPIRAYGPDTLPDLQHDFAASGYNIRQLAARIAAESASPRRDIPHAAF